MEQRGGNLEITAEAVMT